MYFELVPVFFRCPIMSLVILIVILIFFINFIFCNCWQVSVLLVCLFISDCCSEPAIFAMLRLRSGIWVCWDFGIFLDRSCCSFVNTVIARDSVKTRYVGTVYRVCLQLCICTLCLRKVTINDRSLKVYWFFFVIVIVMSHSSSGKLGSLCWYLL